MEWRWWGIWGRFLRWTLIWIDRFLWAGNCECVPEFKQWFIKYSSNVTNVRRQKFNRAHVPWRPKIVDSINTRLEAEKILFWRHRKITILMKFANKHKRKAVWKHKICLFFEELSSSSSFLVFFFPMKTHYLGLSRKTLVHPIEKKETCNLYAKKRREEEGTTRLNIC